MGVSLALDSDDRFRGASLSQGEPAASLGVSYDDKSGLYAGASGVVEGTAGAGVQPLGYVVFAGYARRIGQDGAWDVGATNSNIFLYYRKNRYSYNYTEVYAGFQTGDISGHLYFSPSYLGEDRSTIYAELDGAVHPAPGWRLFGHIGVLMNVADHTGSCACQTPVDWRIGVAREFRNFELHLSWTETTATEENGDYPGDLVQARGAIVVGAARFF